MDFWGIRRDMDRLFNQLERSMWPGYAPSQVMLSGSSDEGSQQQGQQGQQGQQQGQAGGQLASRGSKGGSLMTLGDSFWPSFSNMPVAIDVHESEKGYHISADLPGMNKDEINVSFDNGVLTISGEKKSARDESKDNYHITERSFGKVTRSLRLPRDADAEKTTAQYVNGVLTLELPKKEIPSTKISIQ